MKVLYLAGFGRSGSSILGNVLAQHPDVVHGGELRNLWNDGMILNRRCGCGERFAECSFWSAVSSHLPVDPKDIIAARNRVARTRSALSWIGPQSGQFQRDLSTFAEWTGAACKAISSVSGASLLIDSTMSPVYGRALMEVEGLDIRFVHLVRDPRAVVNAWTREGLQDGEDEVRMRRYTTAGSTIKWAAENLLTEFLIGSRRPVLRVRYEDFVDRPIAATRQIFDFAGEPIQRRPEFTDSHTIDLPVSHTVWGNSSRFLHGIVQIRDDQRWRKEMSFPRAAFVAVTTTPWLGRYRYWFNNGRSALAMHKG